MQSRLERRSRRPQQLPERPEVERRSIGAEPGLGRIEQHASESTWVLHPKRSPVSETHGEAIPLGSIFGRAVEQRADGIVAVDHQPARHAETKAEHRPAVGVEQQQLPDPAGGREAGSDQRGADRGTIDTALEVPIVGRVDRRDRASQRPHLSQAAVRLDLGELGHA